MFGFPRLVAVIVAFRGERGSYNRWEVVRLTLIDCSFPG